MKFFGRFFSLTFFFFLLLFHGSCQSPYLKADGVIEGEEYLVSTPFSATVEEVLVREGQKVTKGQPLAEMDSEDLRIALKNAEANLAVVDAELERIRSLLKRLPQKGGGAGYYARVKKLYDVGGISRAQLNRAKRAVDSGYRRSQVDVWAKELEAKQSKAEAKLEELESFAQRALVEAPEEGVVTKVYVQPGQILEEGDPTFIITNLKEVSLRSSLSEEELGKIRIGQVAVVQIESFPDREFKGNLIWISKKPDLTPSEVDSNHENSKKSFAIKVLIPNSDGIFKPGMPATVRFGVDGTKQLEK